MRGQTVADTQLGRRLSLLLWPTFALLSQLLLFGSWTLYQGNRQEFEISFLDITLTLLPGAAIAVLLVTLFGTVIRNNAYRLAALLAGLHIAVWLEGGLLAWDPGLLDGKPIDWSVDAWRGLIDLPIWAGLILIALVGSIALINHLLTFSKIIFLLQTLFFLVTVSTQDHEADQYATINNFTAMSAFSSRENTVVILLDGLQGDIFRDLIREDPEPPFVQIFSGFINFDQHTSLFPTTFMTVPALLSGKIYRNDETKQGFIQRVIERESIFPVLRDQGYQVDLASDKFEVNLYRKGFHTDSYAIPNNLHLSNLHYTLDDTVRMVDLILFRHTPHLARKSIYRDQSWLLQSMFSTADFGQLRYFAHNHFLQTLAQKAHVADETKRFKLFHLMTTHTPFIVNRDCTYAQEALPIEREHATNQSRCALNEVAKLFSRMKQLGIYETANIVLLSDHGAWIAPEMEPKILEDGTLEYVHPAISSMALSTMAIKPAGNTGEITHSAVPTTIIDLPATLSALLGLGHKFPGENVFSLKEGEKREREYLYYQWRRGDWTSSYMGPMTRFLISGNPYHTSSWEQKGILAPPQQ